MSESTEIDLLQNHHFVKMFKMSPSAENNQDMIIGVSLISVSGDVTTSLGVIIVEDASLTLPGVRYKLSQQLSCLPSSYIFCTKQKWSIGEHQESQIRLDMLLTENRSLYIKLKYGKPKVGVKLKNGVVLGFVYINYNCNVSNLRSVLYNEFVAMDKFSDQFIILDCNGWPIRKNQEESLLVLEILCKDNTITLLSDIIYNDLPLTSQHTKDSILSDTPPRKKIKRLKELTFCSNKDVYRTSCSHDDSVSLQHKQILISYVRAEAAEHALKLKLELSSLGYSVYLDVHEIKSGIDWQDSLNYAVSNCQIFLPLITPRYGETQWTNREIKLADVLGKYILPISFLEKWPPRCLAIQFASTQYIGWKTPIQLENDIKEYGESKAKDIRYWDDAYINGVSQAIANRLKQIVNIELERLPSLTRRKTIMKTFAGKLPEGTLSIVSDGNSSCDVKTPNIVLCVHPSQLTFSCYIKQWLINQHYNVWCSNDKDVHLEDSDTLPPSQPSQISQEYNNGNGVGEPDAEYVRCFQDKADECDVVIIILSKEFTRSRTCQQQVFYCEQRKPMIPLQYEDVCVPGWLSMLIGSSTYQSIHQDGYQDMLLSQIQRCIDSKTTDNLQEEMNHNKINTAVKHIHNMMKDTQSIYISGSTKFYHHKSQSICRSIGTHLASIDDLTLVNGGFYGVGETLSKAFYDETQKLKKKNQVWHILPVKDDQDRRQQGKQGLDGKFHMASFGNSLFCGESVRERESIVAKAFDICILIEGGPGAAHEVEEFVWNDHVVIPVVCTGGAAGGKFNVPDKIFQVPNSVSEEDWEILRCKNKSADELGRAVVNIVKDLLRYSKSQQSNLVSMTSTSAIRTPDIDFSSSPHISPSTPSLTTQTTLLLK